VIKDAEEKVLDQLHFMETLMDTIPSPIFYKDSDGRYLGCNRGFENAVGITRGDLTGKTVHDLYPTELADKYLEMDQALIDNPGTQTYEFAIECEDGSRREVIFNKATYGRGSDGRVAGLVGVVTDITEHKRTEEENEKQLTRLEALRSIDMAINASLDLRVTFDVILDQVTRQLHVDAADLLLYNKHLHVLEYASGRGFRTRSLRHTNLGIGESYAGKAALERRTVSIPDLKTSSTDFDNNGAFAEEGFVTYMGVPLIAKGEVKGVLEIFNRSPLDPDRDWREFLNTLAGQAAIALDNSTMFDDLQRSNVELTLAYDVTIEGWARALDLRDRETEGHSRRVTDLTLRLAREIGLPEPELVHVRRGALLHDIGKMGVPDEILLKPGKLTDEEWDVMRRHPVYAFEMLSPIEFLRPAIDIPYCHHERWDGTGYPRGLKKEGIPLAARIFAVVDIYDATSSDRPYRRAWPREKVLANLEELAGTHLDPRIVSAFVKIING
jgi:PAS domain S-box-containing protein/putative nucleotidyltransferase with HDIG domain